MILGLIASLTSSTLITFLWIRPFCRSLGISLPASLGISYLWGLAVVSEIVLLLWITGLPVSATNLSLVMAGLSLFGILFYSRKRFVTLAQHSHSREEKKKNWFIILLGVYLLTNLILILLAGLSLPIYAWDTITSEALKAKIVFHQESLSPLAHTLYPNFPPYTFSALLWGALGQGIWDDSLMHLIFFLGFLAFIVVFYDLIHRRWGRLAALISVALLFSSNLLVIHATLSYRDLLLMAHHSLALLFIILFPDTKKNIGLTAAAICAACALLTKIEAIAYYPVYMIALWTARTPGQTLIESLKNTARFFLITAAVYMPVLIYKWIINGNDTAWCTLLDFSGLLTRSEITLTRFAQELFLMGNWNPVFWPAFILCTCLWLMNKKRSRESRSLILSVALCFIVYAFTFTFTTSSFNVTIPFTISRYFLHFFPLAVLFTILTMHELIFDKEPHD